MHSSSDHLSKMCTLLLVIMKTISEREWRGNCVMRPFIIFVLVFVIVFGMISNWYMFRMMTVPAITGGLLLPWCGFMFGCFMSIITRRSPNDVTAIAIETGVQNTGIAILVIKVTVCNLFRYLFDYA
uniref:Na_Ca_ex domain-containing protein n=1 Tax=Angiostrongylus cantonensis TaxID=6313 RepID=A0A0K0D639_ANGCA